MFKINISKSIEINASADKIYKVLGDFNHWKYWSPWLLLEANAQVKVSDNAKYFEWEGKRIGTGNMKVMNETYLKLIEYDLNFLKPWKPEAKVQFNIQHNGDSCIVTWQMDSRLPFFMFWMKPKIETFTGLDYERGLEMLKDYMEQGEVPSEVSIIGEQEFEGMQYIGVNAECSFDKLAVHMKTNFRKMRTYLTEQEELVPGVGFSIYNSWDFKKKIVNYTSGFSVSEVPQDLSSECISGIIPKTSVFTVKHTGAYRHIGNAWAVSASLSRAKIFTPKKKSIFFEVYPDNPDEVTEKELCTEIHFPVKEIK